MKKSFVRRATLSVFLFAFIGSTGWAQFSPDSPVGVSAGFIKLFGSNHTFTAHAEVQALDTNRVETLRGPMNFAMLTGKVRMDIDMAQMQGQQLNPLLVRALKQAGLDKITSILRLDKRTIHLVFPGSRSFVNMEMSQADLEAAQKNVQVQRTALGKETIDNHVCTRNRVVVKNAKGVALFEGLTWNASDLKDFPVKISAQTKEGTTVMQFSQIQLASPAAAQFEVPASFTRYASTEDLFLAIAQKQSGSPKATTTPKPAAPKKPVSSSAPTTTTKPRSASSSGTQK